jgi:AcrR family transcriptional regulator
MADDDTNSGRSTGGRSGRRSTAVARDVSRKPGDERWQELLDASAQQFAANGYAATSLQMIADEMGLLKGSLYYYINSKEDLLYEVIKAVYVSGVENFRALTAGEGDAATRLRAALEGHVVYLIDHLVATTVYLHEFERLSKDRRDELGGQTYLSLLRQLIVDGREDGSLRPDLDPHLTAMVALGSTNWLYRWYHPGTMTPREIGREFADILVRGMTPSGT